VFVGVYKYEAGHCDVFGSMCERREGRQVYTSFLPRRSSRVKLERSGVRGEVRALPDTRGLPGTSSVPSAVLSSSASGRGKFGPRRARLLSMIASNALDTAHASRARSDLRGVVGCSGCSDDMMQSGVEKDAAEAQQVLGTGKQLNEKTSHSEHTAHTLTYSLTHGGGVHTHSLSLS
jgi:hypothetical protein